MSSKFLIVTKEGKTWTTDTYPVSRSDIHLIRSGELLQFRFNEGKKQFERLKIIKHKTGSFTSQWILIKD